MLTPKEIEALSEPVVEVYRACVDELLINIARHLKAGNTGSLEWQTQKLGEFGQLRRENIEIIKQYTGNIPELLNGTLGEALAKTLSRIDPELSKAAALGLFAGIDLKPEAAQEINNILSYYSAQAVEQFNLVNTVMLDHSLEQYRRVLADTSVYELKLDKAQAILNEQTGAVAMGISSRQEALRKAVQQMNAAGLRGFRDAGGHYWSAEAYVNMDIRTTVHNVATQAVFTRNEQYGNALVAVSAHAGARELCYPYQGRVYSTDGSSGTVEDLHGNMLDYDSLDNTSYGLPAGLLGINCGHFISPFIPGLSVIRDTPQDKEENDRQYALSQQQRRLEREVRYAKREAAMMDAMGDKAGFEKAAAKVKQKQENLGKFVTSTGRTARSDRTQVQGYGRSLAGKVSAANGNNSGLKSAASGGIITKKEAFLSGSLHEAVPIRSKAIDGIPVPGIFDDKQKDIRYQIACQDLLQYAKYSTKRYPIDTEYARFYDYDVRPIKGQRFIVGESGKVSAPSPKGIEAFHFFHTHENGDTLSAQDIYKFSFNPKMVSITAVGNDGSLFCLIADTASDRDELQEFVLRSMNEAIYWKDDKPITLNDVMAMREQKDPFSGFTEQQTKELMDATEAATRVILERSEGYGFRYFEFSKPQQAD